MTIDIWRTPKWIVELLRHRCWDAPRVEAFSVEMERTDGKERTVIVIERRDL